MTRTTRASSPHPADGDGELVTARRSFPVLLGPRDVDALQHEREQLRIGMEAEERKRQHEAELENNKQIEELRLKQEVANAALQLERDKQAMVRAHTCSHVAAAGVSD